MIRTGSAQELEWDTIRDAAGAPTVPTELTAWASLADGSAAVSIEVDVIGASVVGTFTPTRAGEWLIVLAISEPIVHTRVDKLRVHPVPRRPPAPVPPVSLDGD